MSEHEQHPFEGLRKRRSARFERGPGDFGDEPRPHQHGARGRDRGPRGEEPGFAPGFPPGFGPGPRGGRRGERGGRRGGPGGPGGRDDAGGWGRGRAQRGDVRTAILLVLSEQPMHGYQIMQAITDRTNGAWRPSPGAIYPTIAQLADEGLVTVQEEGGRKLVTLTSEGQTRLAERTEQQGDPFAGFADEPAGPDLRAAMHELAGAARQIGMSGTAAQREAAAKVINSAKRSLYLLLAGEPEDENS